MKKISDRVTSNKKKHLLVETEFKKLEKFDAAYFRGKNYFDGDGTQNYLVFQPLYKYFERVGNAVSSWESKGLSSEKIPPASTSYSNRVPEIVYDNARIKLELTGVPLKQDKVTYNHGPIVNNHIVYKQIPNSVDFGLTVENSLFGAAKLTKSVDISNDDDVSMLTHKTIDMLNFLLFYSGLFL